MQQKLLLIQTDPQKLLVARDAVANSSPEELAAAEEALNNAPSTGALSVEEARKAVSDATSTRS